MVDREELLRRARELVPLLRQRASHTEELRRLPEETVADLHANELMRAAQPKRFGGFDLDYEIVLEIASELGRGCGSTAWCYSIWASHNWVAGMYSEQAQEEYWADSVDTLSSTSLNPSKAQVTPADGGGYLLSGRWSFSSGCDEAAWAMLAGTGSQGLLYFLVPKSDFTIDDNWFVSGLKGTGSKDITIESTFVPAHRALPQVDLQESRTPGRELHGTPNFRIPHLTMFPYTLAAPVLGVARGALEEFERHMIDRVAYTTGEKLGESAPVHIRLAEAEAEIHAAQLIMRNDCREVFALARNNELPTLKQRAGYRRNQAYVAKLSVQAVNRLFEASGGNTLYDSSPMQRFHRDAHAASHHFGLSWDTAAEQFGRNRLGLGPKDPARI